MTAIYFVATLYFPMEVIVNQTALGNSYPGDIVGMAVTLETGVIGNALHVGASTSYINLGPIRNTCFGFPDLCPRGFTLALWLKRTALGLTHNRYYVSNGGQTSSSYGICIYGKNPNSIGVSLRTTAKRWRIAPIPVPEGSWHHIMFTWSKSAHASAYVDGKLEGTQTSPVDEVCTSTIYNDFMLGTSNKSPVTKTGDGLIDEMLFWDEWKPAEAVAEVYGSYQQAPSEDIFTAGFDAINEQPIDEVEPMMITYVEKRRGISECTRKCYLLAPWCSVIVWDGSCCKIYNVYNLTGISRLLITGNKAYKPK